MATFYFPYGGRQRAERGRPSGLLENGRADDIADRAVAQAFGFGSPVDATLLAADPFLLLPSFLSPCPAPLGRLALDDGMLTVVDGAMTWVVVPITLRHEAFDLKCRTGARRRHRWRGRTDRPDDRRHARPPGGAIFFADYGARTAIEEASGCDAPFDRRHDPPDRWRIPSTGPLLLNLLAVATGIAMAFAGTFLVFGGIHVAALLFGTSLIGVVVDYGLLYSTMAFGAAAVTGPQRLAYVLPSITLGSPPP